MTFFIGIDKLSEFVIISAVGGKSTFDIQPQPQEETMRLYELSIGAPFSTYTNDQPYVLLAIYPGGRCWVKNMTTGLEGNMSGGTVLRSAPAPAKMEVIPCTG